MVLYNACKTDVLGASTFEHPIKHNAQDDAIITLKRSLYMFEKTRDLEPTCKQPIGYVLCYWALACMFSALDKAAAAGLNNKKRERVSVHWYLYGQTILDVFPDTHHADGCKVYE